MMKEWLTYESSLHLQHLSLDRFCLKLTDEGVGSLARTVHTTILESSFSAHLTNEGVAHLQGLSAVPIFGCFLAAL